MGISRRPKTKVSSSTVKGKSYKERGDRAAAATPAKPKPKAKVYSNRDAAPKPAKPKVSMPKVDTSRVRAKFGEGDAKTVMHRGKRMANVTADQLKKTGLSLREYMNTWNKTGKRP